MSETKMKYVAFDGCTGEQIIVFPEKIQHLQFANEISKLSFGSMNAISGGFVSNGKCHGRSVSLRMDSRGDLDTALLEKLKG